MDIFGEDEMHRTIGIQCKNTMATLSEKTLLTEIENAETFYPPLTALYIATSTDRDSKLQERARIISFERISQKKFPVHILFWNDVTGDLAKNEVEFMKYFGDFFVHTEKNVAGDDNDRRTFSVDEMDIKRHSAFSGKSISRQKLLNWGFIISVIGLLGMLLIFARIFGPNSGNWAPLAMLFCGLGLTIVMLAQALARRKFEYFLKGNYYLEASASDRIYLNRLTATCPWCASHMGLSHLGPKNGVKEDIFVCEKNPRQHKILLDFTLLPEMTD
ncbi:hypothetical protein [Pseudoduganella albidiflava]|uniref:Restriction endonuclease type IV Mrr domain-containing protein n=1 Tax=Pseudoduganella albidiflava TaxID=321983 RepID=A0AA87XWS7_9BURK|nr:hypothetical protein [Pseudoduganella albidiflava]GGY62010.1 hypothetical protein GCM10007387_50750 [Pseudoduganella albidiflava]